MNGELIPAPAGPSRIATFWVREPELNVVPLGPVRNVQKPKYLRAKRRVTQGKLKTSFSHSEQDGDGDNNNNNSKNETSLKALKGTSLERRLDIISNERLSSTENEPNLMDPITNAISRVAESNRAAEWKQIQELPRIPQPFPYQRMKTDFFLPPGFKSSKRFDDLAMPKRSNTFLAGSIFAEFGKGVDLALDLTNVSPNNLPYRPHKSERCLFVVPKKKRIQNKKIVQVNTNSYRDFTRSNDFTYRQNTGIISPTRIPPARKIGAVRVEQSQSFGYFNDDITADRGESLTSSIEALAMKRGKTVLPSSYGYHARSHSPTFKRLVEVNKVLVGKMQHIPDYSPRQPDAFKSLSFTGGRISDASESEMTSTSSLPLINPPPQLEIKPKFPTEEVHLFLPKVTQDEDSDDDDGHTTSSAAS